jgi:hypothetical protein
MQIVELKVEETKAVVGGLTKVGGGGELGKIIGIIRTIEKRLGIGGTGAMSA